MKKIIAMLLTLVMLTGISGALAESADGGWSAAEDNTVTEERKAVFDKALEGLTGVDYEPIAYLGSQVVAGTNHCFLCRATVVYPDAEPTLKLVFIYEDLEGNAEILQIADFDFAALCTPAE